MKRILITGSNSYIGKSFEKWLENYPDRYSVDSISLRTDSWKEKDFLEYDVVFRVAGIVHKKEKPELETLYFDVNRDLTLKVANRARESGVKQFIFMSTMSVYGIDGRVDQEVVITRETVPEPKTFYGKSKLEAENNLQKLNSENFKVLIIRPPMIYGPKCPGNFTRLRNLILKTPTFPLFENKRSMLFIDNLSEFIRLVIERQESGLFFPQNRQYVSTLQIVKLIAQRNSRKIYLSKFLSTIVRHLSKRINLFNKLFGNLVIDSELSDFSRFNYDIVDFKKSIEYSDFTLKK